MLVLITDAPPHGFGYPEDSYPLGDPSGLHPFGLVETLARDGVNLYTIGVEPHSANSGADRILFDLARIGHGFYCALQPHHHLHRHIAAIACTLTLQSICAEELLISNSDPRAAAAAAFGRMKAASMPQLVVGPNGMVTDIHREALTPDRIYNEYLTSQYLPPPPPFSRY